MFETGKINAHGLIGSECLSFLNKTWGFETNLVVKTEWVLKFARTKADNKSKAWCPEEDSNLHTLRHTDLNRARLPIPPSGLKARIMNSSD